MNPPLYRIKDWNEIYENNRTRSLKEMQWVPVPNQQDGDGYRTLVENENGAAHLGAWLAILQVASRCGMRGTLLRDGAGPHTARSIGRMSGIPAPIIQEALDRLSDPEIGWLEIVQTPANADTFEEGVTIPQEGAGSTSPSRTPLRGSDYGMEWNGMEGKIERELRARGPKPENGTNVSKPANGEPQPDDPFYRDLLAAGARIKPESYIRLRDGHPDAFEDPEWRKDVICAIENTDGGVNNPWAYVRRWAENHGRFDKAGENPEAKGPRKRWQVQNDIKALTQNKRQLWDRYSFQYPENRERWAGEWKAVQDSIERLKELEMELAGATDD